MAHAILIASLVGASGVASLASAVDLGLMQMSTAADPKSWICTLKSDATADEVKTLCNEFQNPFCTGTEECPPGAKCPE
eukprot:8685082-Pyramimonas_sp.AAC.1